MAGGHKSWHKMPGEKQEHYEMFMVWLGLPYEDPPKERTVREVYRRTSSAPMVMKLLPTIRAVRSSVSSSSSVAVLPFAIQRFSSVVDKSSIVSSAGFSTC
jgi:hypothetical protein